MIVELTPETYFTHIKQEGPLHVVMHYGANCGPCKATMPHYIRTEEHFLEYNVRNVKFYKFHQWEQSYKEFIAENNLKTEGVPTFRYFYMGDVVNEEVASFRDPNNLKNSIMNTIKGIETALQMEFNLYAG